MINVAVSRAKHRFTLVTGDEVFTANNGHIAALMRYVTYYAQDEQVVRAPVVSAFDLLYREFDQSLARLEARLRSEDSRYKSEQIVAQLLREALSDPSCQALMYHHQVKLDQVASPSNPDLTQSNRVKPELEPKNTPYPVPMPHLPPEKASRGHFGGVNFLPVEPLVAASFSFRSYSALVNLDCPGLSVMRRTSPSG